VVVTTESVQFGLPKELRRADDTAVLTRKTVS
jgi:hypothetical protein